MSNIDKQALREAANAANAASWGYWEPYKPHKGARGYEVKVGVKAVAQHCLKVDSVFIPAANPATVLALLDELEAKDSMIAAQQHEIRTLLNALEGRPCPKCNDTGMADSGGTQPWGEPISVPCDCTAQPALAVDADDNFYSWFGREWHEHYQQNQYTTAAKQMLGVMAESAWKAGRRAAMLQGAEPVSNRDELLTVCAEAYQVVGAMAEALGIFDITEVQKVMDNLSQQKLVHADVLPFAVPGGNSPVIPDGLRLALSNAGIAAPESDEMLAATCEKHIQELVTWVKDRKPFRSTVNQDGWVACSERMPEYGEKVLTSFRGGVRTAVCKVADVLGHKIFVDELTLFNGVPAEYWQPLPAAPHFREIVNSATNNFRENAETSTKCWCHTCRPVTISDMRFVVCPECGNKRCPHANDHRNACTGSNEPGQEGSAYPAAPQQNISHALAKGMERYGDAMQELAKREVK